MWRWVASFVLFVLAPACGGDDSAGDPDASIDAGGGVTPPAPPAPVTMAPCPAGWREIGEGGVVVCDPWPEGGPSECADDEAHFVGEPGCSRIGTECPADGLPVVPDGVTTVYVLAEAAPGGDGSRARPFQHFTDASVSSLGSGTVIALGRGTYEGRMLVPDGVTLRGACVTETRITTPSALETEPTVFVTRGAATVSNLTIVDAAGPGRIASGEGVSLTVEDVVVRRASVGAVIVLAGASLSARGVVIDETQPTSVGTFGRGVEVDDGASAALMRVVVRRSSDTAVHVGGPGTRFMATDLAVRETFEENGRGGRGLNVQLGATGVIEGAAIEESHEVGVYVGADAAELEATHLVIRDTHAQSRDGQKGDGMIVELGAHARVSSILIERSDEIGILVWDPGTTLEIVDGVVRDTLGVTSPEGSGIGLAQFRESSVRGTRLLVERAGVIGIAALEGSQGEFEDVTVRDISADETTGAFGRGMDTSRSTLRVARALIERTHEVGVMVLGEGATLDAEDIVVRDTDSTPIGGALGISCVVQLGGAAVVTRAIFERSHTGGVFAIGRGTRTELSDVIIRGVSRPPCAEASTCELPVAIGLSSNDGASLTTSRFEVTNAGDCGVQVTEDAGLDLRDGVIAANSIGACVQQDGYDLSRLSTNVRYSDNGTSLDATMLPIPMPLDATSTP